VETKEILSQQWVEVPQRQEQGLRPLVLRPKSPSVQKEEHVVANPATVDTSRVLRIANRKLCDITGTLMDKVGYMEHYGRIVVVKFIPIRRVDPIVAVPCVEMAGWSGFVHNMAYSELCNDLMDAETGSVWSYRKWYKRTKRNVVAIIKHSKKFLRQDEWAYYSDQMYETLANPQRKIGKKSTTTGITGGL
jgi:hypothetical protein